MVSDRHFLDDRPCAMSENGHETVKTIERRQELQNRASEDPQVAAAVAEIKELHAKYIIRHIGCQNQKSEIRNQKFR